MYLTPDAVYTDTGRVSLTVGYFFFFLIVSLPLFVRNIKLKFGT